MPSLPELQGRFLDALLGGDAGPALALTREAAPRLGIYCDHSAAIFEEALRSTYPALLRLVGPDYFSQLARQFQRFRPSRRGDLRHVGAGFADWLGPVLPSAGFEYLPDVARFEWLVQECLLAAAPPPLDLAALTAVAPADYDELRFVVHPSLALFQSDYPIKRIWEANLASDGLPDVIDLSAGGDRLALLQRRAQLEFHPLEAGEYAFLGALAQSAGFAAAIDAGCRAVAVSATATATAAPTAFDPSAALRRFVAAEVIVDFHRPASPRG